MYDAFKTNLESSVKESLTPDQFVSLLVANEWDYRKNRAVERAVCIDNFRYKASIEQIDYSIERGLDRYQMHRLPALDFIKEHKDLFITGFTGTGKSYLVTVLCYQVYQEGYRVMYGQYSQAYGAPEARKGKRYDPGRTQAYRADRPANPR